MHPVDERYDVQALADQAWLRDLRTQFDVVTSLAAALSPDWAVERTLDPFGDLSVVVLPPIDSDGRPTFVLYEENGLVQVSTFADEDWQSRRSFRTCERAVAAIVAAAA